MQRATRWKIAVLLLLLTGFKSEKVVLPERGLCAHRGAMATHPENTLPAFREAIKAGAHMIEFDVFLTRDNHMVVMHDETVDRTTNGTGKVADLTLDQIKDLDAGSWKSQEFKETRVPTLDEVLAIMPVNIWLNIHLKGEGRLPVMVAQKLASENRLHQAFLACSRSAALLAGEAVAGIMICNMDRQDDDASYVDETINSKADFIQLRQPITPSLPDYTKRLKEKGIRINFFGTDSPDEIRKLLGSGVDFPLVNDITGSMKVAEEVGINPVKPEFKSGRKEKADDKTKRILAIGDSNGALPEGWVEQLEHVRSGDVIYNTCISGNTIGFDNNGQKSLNTLRNIIRYMDNAYDQMGDINDIIIMLGSNDCKAVFKDSIKTVPESFSKLLKMIRDHPVYRKCKPRLYVVSPPPMGRDEIMIEKYHGGAERVALLQPQFKKIAGKNKAAFIDIYSILLPVRDKYSSDGVHLIPEGQKIIAETVNGFLNK